MLRILSKRAASQWQRSIVRFVKSELGQDVIEYALLAAFIGIVGWAAVSVIDEAVGVTYSSYLSPTSGVPSLWQPGEPVTSGSGS